MCNSLRKDHGRIYGESDKSGEDDYDHIQVAYERAAREAVLDTANSDHGKRVSSSTTARWRLC